MCFKLYLGQVGTYRPCSTGLLCFLGQNLRHRNSAFFPSLKEKPILPPAVGHGLCCGHTHSSRFESLISETYLG